MKTVIITGVAGFIGRYVARQFAKEGWRVVGLDNRPPENAQLSPGTLYHRMTLPNAGFADLLRAVKPKVCVHCAGRASVQMSIEDPAADFRDSAVLTFELLETLRRTVPRCRTLLLSSAAVYGNPESLPVKETTRVAPLSPYGYHKYHCELLCEEYSRLYGLRTASLRVFSAYGAGLRRQVIWDICQRVFSSGKLELHGTGKESRDFIHATDIARAVALLAEKAAAHGEAYNVATGREVAVSELANLLVPMLVKTVKPTFDGITRAGDPLNWRADISKIAALGFKPTIDLEQGLRNVATWATAELGGM